MFFVLKNMARWGKYGKNPYGIKGSDRNKPAQVEEKQGKPFN